jgi:hypothetical protein
MPWPRWTIIRALNQFRSFRALYRVSIQRTRRVDDRRTCVCSSSRAEGLNDLLSRSACPDRCRMYGNAAIATDGHRHSERNQFIYFAPSNPVLAAAPPSVW